MYFKNKIIFLFLMFQYFSIFISMCHILFWNQIKSMTEHELLVNLILFTMSQSLSMYCWVLNRIHILKCNFHPNINHRYQNFTIYSLNSIYLISGRWFYISLVPKMMYAAFVIFKCSLTFLCVYITIIFH